MQKKIPSIMIQGTCSNAGKSLLTAALCRIFVQDGLSPAPFKAQNMALNSFVTLDGYEIGRAQALQAVACKREPHVHMNPVLLKPNSHLGSQVIVLGKAVGHMRFKEYMSYKANAWKAVVSAYKSLSTTADVIVIEGAGSAAEINLKANDIVNMAMAKHACAPVLLCADIDRGGAFASLVGTMALLEEDEKKMVAGFILNKFRGDLSLLQTAFAPIENMTNKPFLGTIPWIENLQLPEEDSVSFRLYGPQVKKHYQGNKHILDVAILDLKHLSNFTDLDALKVEPDVHLRMVRHRDELGKPDMLILLGTKNTLSDLQHLQEKGLIEAVQNIHTEIPYILGICGGLQMLGQSIEDSCGYESGDRKSINAFNLLPLKTSMQADKILRRCSVNYMEMPIYGYEIHHGVTELRNDYNNDILKKHARCVPILYNMDGQALGYEVISEKQTIFGTYIHGLLDNDVFRRHMLNIIRQYKGFEVVNDITPYSLEKDLDKLANVVRENLDMKKIYSLLTLP